MANTIFPRNTKKKKFEEKNDVSRVTRKSAILTIKKMEILKRSHICLQNVAKQSRY